MFFTGDNSNRKIILLPIHKLQTNPNQTRRVFEEKELSSLADSIRQNGILQPLTVRKLMGDSYELIAGERRLRAAVLAGLDKVPCILCQIDAQQSAVLCLLENLQRQDLNFFEEAEGISLLILRYHLTQGEIAEKLGKQQSTIANKLRILKLSEKEKSIILENHLTERHARALLSLENEEERKKILLEAVQRGYTVSQLEEKIFNLTEHKKKQRKKPVIIVKDVRIFLNTMHHAVSLMKQSGVSVQEMRNETDEYLEYVIRIDANHQQKGSIA